jgi:hypothetical protein
MRVRAVFVVPLGVAALVTLHAVPARGQTMTSAAEVEAADEGTTGAVVKGVEFVGGAAMGLAAHEGGHLLFDALFGANPGIKKVEFGGIPFFAITHDEVSRRREFVISSAGFWVQEGLSEYLLTARPNLRSEHAPVAKGTLAFCTLASFAYGAAALGGFGPPERDTRSMALSLGISERWVGVIVLVPAVLDLYRYFHPQAAWAAWGSRGAKIGSVLLVLK